MSVPMSKRGESKLELVVCTVNIVNTLLDIWENEKYIPKRKRFGYPQAVVDVATSAMINFTKANGLTITTNEERFKLRQEYQLQGFADIQSLDVMLNLLYKRFNIPNGLMEVLFTNIETIQSKFRNWQYSDRVQYKNAVEKQKEKESK